MLELVGISHHVPRKGQDPLVVLDHVSFKVPSGHLMAVVGPTMSGKTSLIDVVAGQRRASGGTMMWHGREIIRRPVEANGLGWVPRSDDVLYDVLTVQESIVSAMMLRIAGLSRREAIDRTGHLLALTGLETVAGYRVGALQVAARRRIKLAVALVTDPTLVLCDDFTDGLDARSERELALLLQAVARDNPKRVVINATQNLSNLGTYDTVLLLHEGHVCFHGPVRALAHYFSAKTIEEVYPRLARRPADRWGESWSKHRDSYYDAFKLGSSPENLAAPSTDDDKSPSDPDRVRLPRKEDENKDEAGETEDGDKQEETPVLPLPSLVSQVHHILLRQWTVFRRRPGEWVTHLLLLALLPMLVTMLVWRHKDPFPAMRDGAPIDPGVLLTTANAVSMAVFLQVLLVIFMGVFNGSKAVAGERLLFERERRAGLRTSGYLIAKVIFAALFFTAQGAWMVLCADMMTGSLPGNAITRLLLVIGAGKAFTLICLGLSANTLSAQRAQSIGFMLAIAQVPFCGALLAVPRLLGILIQPLTTAHHSWSAAMESMKPHGVVEALDKLNGTWLETTNQAFFWLGLHALFGLGLLIYGLAKKKA